MANRVRADAFHIRPLQQSESLWLVRLRFSMALLEPRIHVCLQQFNHLTTDNLSDKMLVRNTLAGVARIPARDVHGRMKDAAIS